MNTKEAIDNVDGVYAQVEGAFCCSTKERNEFEKEKNEVLELLQRGKKFEKIVKGMVEFSESKAFKLHIDENELWKFKLKKIIAEYFPNPDFTEKVMEKINKEVKE